MVVGVDNIVYVDCLIVVDMSMVFWVVFCMKGLDARSHFSYTSETYDADLRHILLYLYDSKQYCAAARPGPGLIL